MCANTQKNCGAHCVRNLTREQLAFALVLVTEPLLLEPVASAAAELAAAEAPTAYNFRDRRQSVGRSKLLPGARSLAANAPRRFHRQQRMGL